MATTKERKELFVSDLVGGPVSEIYSVTGVALTAFGAYCVLQRFWLPVPLLVDYALNKVSLLLAITLYSGRTTALHLLIALPVIGVWVWHKIAAGGGRTTRPAAAAASSPAHKPLLSKKPFLTAYRAHMIIITNLSILAVDFRVFPRRFAKVETWGTSLMDLGVGSFVFSMGLVNSRGVIKKLFARNYGYKFSLALYASLVWANAVKLAPILLLGAIRLASVKSLAYQEHVTEYGIHWNFFFTLGLLPIVIGILDPFLNVLPRAAVALAIAAGYEWALTHTGLLKFILRSDNRMDSLWSQNKEGICSFAGYVSIFIFGQLFGSFVLTNFVTPQNLLWMSNKKLHRRGWLDVTTTQGLVVASAVYGLLFVYVNDSAAFGNISRRLANLPYVLWVVLYNSLMLLGYHVVARLLAANARAPSTGSTVMEAVNNNGLFCFLLGNLLTGLINMSVDTLECSDAAAFAILCGYGAVLAAVAIALDRKKLYIKL